MPACLEHVALKVIGARAGATQHVPVIRREDGLLELDCSPGFVEGVAARDVIRITDVVSGEFEIVHRGGNIALKLFHDKDIESVVNWLTPRISRLAGWIDGRIARAAVFTLPYRGQFEEIESIANEAASAFPGTVWYLGNVYDENDQPLNWWLDASKYSNANNVSQ